jgi:hypothetical protein
VLLADDSVSGVKTFSVEDKRFVAMLYAYKVATATPVTSQCTVNTVVHVLKSNIVFSKIVLYRMILECSRRRIKSMVTCVFIRE